MAKISCPHCCTPVDSGRSVCPNCRAVMQTKRPMTLWLITAGILIVILQVAAAIPVLPAPQPAPFRSPQPAPSPAATASEAAIPPCTIAITGSKNPPAITRLQVMTTTCFAGDIAELTVMINGEKKGKLSSGPGSGRTFTGKSGSITVVVAAKFANSAESVVYRNPAR